MFTATHKPRRPATPPHSRWISRRSVRPRFAAAIWILAATLPGCSSSPELVVLSGDRQVVREADGRYCVSAVWLQERYQLERAMRLKLDQYEAATMQDLTK